MWLFSRYQIAQSNLACGAGLLAAGPSSGGDSGYASVDALVALTILASTLILSFSAMAVTQRLAATALENRRANTMLSYLAQSAPVVVGASSGQDRQFDWRIDVTRAVDVTPKAPPTCAVLVHLVGRSTHRRYALSSLQLCAPTPVR